MKSIIFLLFGLNSFIASCQLEQEIVGTWRIDSITDDITTKAREYPHEEYILFGDDGALYERISGVPDKNVGSYSVVQDTVHFIANDGGILLSYHATVESNVLQLTGYGPFQFLRT